MTGILYRALDIVLLIIQYAIFIRAIISWFPVSRDNPLVRLLYQITEPLLAPVRNMLYRLMSGRYMMIDFSGVIVFFIIGIIRSIIFGGAVIF